MEKSLHNIFCTTNATDLFDQISESSYNVLPEKKNQNPSTTRMIFEGPLNFSTI